MSTTTESSLDTEAKLPAVLIVDDEPSSRELLGSALEFFGYTVQQARDGAEGFTAFESLRPALVVSDVYMPRVSGLHLLRSIRRLDDHAKVVLITGDLHFHQLCGDTLSRPDGFLRKPFEIRNFVSLVHALIGGPTPINRPK